MMELPGVPNVKLRERISPEYQAIQTSMHVDLPHYGSTSARIAEDIKEIIEKHNIKSVLDYGCGKGLLKQALGDIVREYDPGIPGKDAEPEPAELVVCIDVLEHIEPDKLQHVLEHIRQLTLRTAFVTVATRPANKTLPDGRNAHLIIEDSEWWYQKLSVCFEIKAWDVEAEGKELVAIMRPFFAIGEITGVGVMSNDDRFEHVKQNIQVSKKRIVVRKGMFWDGPMAAEGEQMEKLGPMFGYPAGPVRDKNNNLKFRWVVPKPHNRVAILMCYGPSLEDTWESAVKEKALIEKADIVSVSGAHDYVISKGLIPRYHVECDPREHKGDMIHNPQKRTEYLMASCCHPNVVKKLSDYDLTIWHLNNGAGTERILEELEPEGILVPGGGSVGLRSIPLLYILGYRRFIIHGMDCSYREGKSHAGLHTGKKIAPTEVYCNGKKFITAPVLISYKRYFDEHVRKYVGDANTDPSKIEIILRGDGLLQHWLKAGGAAVSYEQSEAA